MKDQNAQPPQTVLFKEKVKATLGWLAIFLALIVLGAHFFRASEYGLALCVAGMVLFLCTKICWRQYAIAFFLFWGTWEWVESAYFLANTRMQAGVPWLRASIILGVVALLTFMAGAYALRRLERQSKINNDKMPFFQGFVFIITMLLLLFLSKKASLDLFLLERYLPVFGKVQIFFSAWYAAFISKTLLNKRKSRSFRKKIWLIFSVVFFAQLLLGVLGMHQMLMTGNLHVPIPAFIILAPIFRGTMSMMPILVLFSVLLVGSAWCSFLCYFGAFDAFAAGKNIVKVVPQKITWLLEYGRIIILALGVLIALILRFSGASIDLAIILALLFGILGVVFMAIFSRKYASMMHCTIFCPMGLLISVLGRFSFWKIKIDKKLCNNCAACEKVCLYRAINEQSRKLGGTLSRCSLCRDCIGVCNKGAISMGCFHFSDAVSQKIFVAIVVILHVLFVTIARV